MGRKRPKQRPLFVEASRAPSAPRHRFYEKLNELLVDAGFDEHAENLCAMYYGADGEAGRPSVAPGVYFRMLLIGYFEGIESERGICWRVEDSLSLRAFLGLELSDRVPERSTLSKIRTRLGERVYHEVFRFVLRMLNETGLLRGKVVGVDSTYLRADASMKRIIRRGSGEGYKAYLKRLAKEAGLENPTDEDARRMDRKRKKKASNEDWVSVTDPDARVCRLKDGRTRLAYKSEHVIDMETGAIVAGDVIEGTQSDTATIESSLESAQNNLERAHKLSAQARDDDHDDDTPTGAAPRIESVTGDKGYHSGKVLRSLKRNGIRTYIPERLQHGKRHWKGRDGRETAKAVYANRARTKRPKGRALQRRRGELVERPFAHVCETGAHRRTRLRGEDNVRKRYLLQLAAANLGLLMRHLLGSGTPRELANAFTKAVEAARRASRVILTYIQACLSDLGTTQSLTVATDRQSLNPQFSPGC